MNYTRDEWIAILDAEENGSPDDNDNTEDTGMGNTRSFGRLMLSAVIVLGIAILGIVLSAGG